MKKITLILIAVLCMGMVLGCSQQKQEDVAGGYTEERDVTSEDMEVFDEAMADTTDAVYDPMKVATQVVAGTNYKFYTKKVSNDGGMESYVYITIFKPLDDEPATVSEIEPVE
jgi:hypothetical protein